MPLLTNRSVQMKMRRLFQILTLTCTLLVLITIASKWSSTSVLNDSDRVLTTINHPTANVPPTHPDVSVNLNANPSVDKSVHGRPDLPKYIHLDLKGAPPKASRFYENFFQFIEELNMGVKGVLVEYEDTLPLQGRLENVSREKRCSCRWSFDCRRRLIGWATPKRTSNPFRVPPKLISWKWFRWFKHSAISSGCWSFRNSNSIVMISLPRWSLHHVWIPVIFSWKVISPIDRIEALNALL